MRQNPVSIIRKAFQQTLHMECPICYQQYNDSNRFPIIMCIGQHSVCKQCCDLYVFKKGLKGQCPQCRKDISKQNIIPFRFLNQIRKTSDQLKLQNSRIRQIIQNQEQLKQLYKQQKQKNQWLVKQVEQKQTKIHTLKYQLQKLKQQKLYYQQKSKRINLEKQQMMLQLQNKRQKELEDNPQSLFNKKNIHQYKKVNIKQYDVQQWIDKNCYYYTNLNLNGKTITAKDFSYMFGNIQVKGKTSFSFTIVNMSKFIGLGIIDASCRNKLSLGRQPNWIVYYNNKYLGMGNQFQSQKGDGFVCGEKVTIVVDFNNWRVQWRVNNKTRLIQTFILKNDVKWVPFVHFNDTNDQIILNQCVSYF